jgi:hypothetical protein
VSSDTSNNVEIKQRNFLEKDRDYKRVNSNDASLPKRVKPIITSLNDQQNTDMELDPDHTDGPDLEGDCEDAMSIDETSVQDFNALMNKQSNVTNRQQ